MVKSDRIQRKFIIRKVVISLDVSLFTSCRQRVVDNCSEGHCRQGGCDSAGIHLLFVLRSCAAGGCARHRKTMLLRAFSKTIGGKFKRIQFTPDLLPSDLTGIKFFTTKKQAISSSVNWPLFSNIILADEINRSHPAHPVEPVGSDGGASDRWTAPPPN